MYINSYWSHHCCVGAFDKAKLNVGRRRIVLAKTSSSTIGEPLAAFSAGNERALHSANFHGRRAWQMSPFSWPNTARACRDQA